MSIVDEVPLSEAEFWIAPDAEREAGFRRLRDDAPIAFFPEPDYGAIPQGPGYWSLTRNFDLRAVQHFNKGCQQTLPLSGVRTNSTPNTTRAYRVPIVIVHHLR